MPLDRARVRHRLHAQSSADSGAASRSVCRRTAAKRAASVDSARAGARRGMAVRMKFHGDSNAGRLIWAAAGAGRVSGSGSLPARLQLHRLDHRARDVARFALHALVGVERVVARRIRLVVADVAVERAARSPASIEAHPVEPVGQRAAHGLDAGDVAVDEHAVHAAGEVLRVVPAASSSALAFAGPCPGSVGSGLPPSAHTRRSIMSLSGLGAWYQYTGVTMMTPCAAHPALVDLGHPVVGLVQRVIGIAAARPMAQRHGGRHAALAREDAAARAPT